MKIIKQVDLSHCSLQSEMILDKCWTTAKHKFPHLLGKPVFCETHPAHCNTARTSELFSCPVPWDIHRASCVVPPYQCAGTWKASRSAVLGCFCPFQSRNSVRHAAFPNKYGEHWPQQLQCSPHSNPALHSSKPDEKTPSLQAPQAPPLHTGVCAMQPTPTFAESWSKAAWKGGSKIQGSSYTKAEIFSSFPSSLLDIPRSLSSELPEPSRLFLYRQMKSLFSCEEYLAHMQVIWRN